MASETGDGIESDDDGKKEVFTFAEPFLFSDMTLLVGDEELHCHRAILSLYSPFFKTMFESQFQETTSNQVILPKDDGVDTVRELLRHLYTPGGRDMDSASAQRLLPLIHRFQIDSLIATAERTMTFSMTDGIAPRMLALADLYGLTHLKQAAIDACSRLDMTRLTEALEETPLSPEMKAIIFGNRVQLLEKCIMDIQRSFTHSCIRMESKLERVPTNHCSNHHAPLSTKTVRIGISVPNQSQAPRERAEEHANVNINIEDENLLVANARQSGNNNSEQPPRRHNARVVQALSTAGTGPNDVNTTTTTEASVLVTTNEADDASQVAVAELPVVCETCVDKISTHIKDLCKRALHKATFVVFKQSQT